jgi:transcription elongation factor Elf1
LTFKISKKELNDFSDMDLIKTIVRNERSSCSNYHTPLAERLKKIIKRLDDNEILEVNNMTCPRCNKQTMKGYSIYNSHSITKGHEGVMICNDCGTEESLVLGGYNKTVETLTRQIKWQNKKL